MSGERQLDVARALGVLVLVAALALVMARIQPDAAFVSYRYARHLAASGEFVFNPGDRQTHITVSPVYVLLLTGLAQLIPYLPVLGGILSAIFLGAGGLLLLTANSNRIETAIAAFAYITFPLWWLETGVETALVMLLALAAVLVQVKGYSLAAALLVGLAMVVRPVTFLLGLILVIDEALNKRRVPWLEIIALGLMALLWATLAVWSFGLPLPRQVLFGGIPAGPSLPVSSRTSSALIGLGRVSGALLQQSPVWVGVLLLALVGLTRLFERWWPLLVIVWAALHGVTLDILRISPTRGDYAPLVLAFAVLVGLGVSYIRERLAERVSSRMIVGSAILLLAGALLPSLTSIRQAPQGDDAFRSTHGEAMLPQIPGTVHRQAGEWLAENAPDDAIVAALNIGELGFYSEREMLDAGGLLRPQAKTAIRRGDELWFIPAFAPDFVVVSRSSLLERGGFRPLDDEWFASAYEEATRIGDASLPGGPLVIYRRLAEPFELTPIEADARFANRLRLNGMATDLPFDTLQANELAVFRLEWTPGRALPGERFLIIRLENHGGSSAGQTSQIGLTEQWPVGQALTTFHSFETANVLTPGLYELRVGVGPTLEQLEWQSVAQTKVPIGDTPFGGGLTGGGGRWPGLAALRGYRLNRTEASLEVGLVWDALGEIEEELEVQLSLHDDEGLIVASSAGPPRDGTYPTSIWADGETIPDEHIVALDDVEPGEYNLRIGWLTAEGEAVPTEDGQSALTLGRVFVEGTSRQ